MLWLGCFGGGPGKEAALSCGFLYSSTSNCSLLLRLFMASLWSWGKRNFQLKLHAATSTTSQCSLSCYTPVAGTSLFHIPNAKDAGIWEKTGDVTPSFQLLDIHTPLSFYVATQCATKICLLLVFTYGYFLILGQWQSKVLVIYWLSTGWVRWVHGSFQSNRHIPIKTPHYRIEVTVLGICTGLRPSRARLIKFSCRHLSAEDQEAWMTDAMTILYQFHEVTKDSRAVCGSFCHKLWKCINKK